MKSSVRVTNKKHFAFYQHRELDACNRAAVADAGRLHHVCARSDHIVAAFFTPQLLLFLRSLVQDWRLNDCQIFL